MVPVSHATQEIENRIATLEPDIAKILAALCYHLHPDIVSRIQRTNRDEKPYFEQLFHGRIEVDPYLFDGSACVFPGVRRYVSGRGKVRSYNPGERAILDSNEFPRHAWCFLMTGNTYNGPNWKNSGLGQFELAHVFSHKQTELDLERRIFHSLDDDVPPFGNFTCAANVALLPKGTVRPTDNSAAIKSVFFKRHIELYGENTLAGRGGFRDELVPNWYGDLVWNPPFLPRDWEAKLERLLAYRRNCIERLLSNAVRA